jgi:glycosyltransferase involved in cell wall biosynthesis
MKIAVSIPGREAIGGVCSAQWAFAVSLRMRGHEVRCLVPTARWVAFLRRFVPAKLRDLLIEARAPAQARMFNPRFVLTSDWYALWHRRHQGIPIFHGGYGLTLRHAPPPTFLGWAKTSLLWWLQRRAAARAPCFVAVSREAVEMFRLPHGRTLFNGMDLDRLLPPSAEDKCAAKAAQGFDGDVVMMAGRLSLEKRLESVLDLPQREKRRYLVCIPDAEEADRFAASCAGRGDILVRSFPRGIPEDFWSAVDLLYMPSLYEGCSLLWIEAAARGIPVVATKVGHLIELAEEHPDLSELLLERHDLAPAAKKIDAALARRESWRGRMRALAEQHHDIRQIGERLEALLLEADAAP